MAANGGQLPNWWKVCFVYGDQTKVYRKLYGRKSHVRSLKSYAGDLSATAAATANAGSSGISDGDLDSM
jgi:hypothetical protein